MHKLLVNRLFKLAKKKVWLGELTVPPWPYIAVDFERKATKQTNKNSIAKNCSRHLSKYKFFKTLTLYLLVLTADNYCKQLGPRSDLTKCQA